MTEPPMQTSESSGCPERESSVPVRLVLWCTMYAAVLIWSAWKPTDRLTWWMEVLPALALALAMALCRKRFRPTPLLCVVILVHCAVLFIGGHYTYAEVPMPNLFGDLFGHGRNNYDKIGHFMQGVTPAMLARELYRRYSPLKSGRWLGFSTICISLAVSAFYELIEWWVSVSTGEGADAFLGTQGYIWDTQSDMLMALIGAIVANLLLSRFQDRQQKLSLV